MSGSSPAEMTLERFAHPETVAFYEDLPGLLDAERDLFAAFVPPGSRVLDLGVGAGRTTAALSATASRYVGLDYAAPMIDACRARFPGLDFVHQDARDLAQFARNEFDVVVFSFNGVDYLFPAEARHACLCEIARVLRPGGTFIVASHNPRALLAEKRVRPTDTARLRRRKAVRRIAASVGRTARAVRSAPFWRGAGYLHDPTHGGLHQHAWSPRRARLELRAHGFTVLTGPIGVEHPRPYRPSRTGWYYLALRRDP